MTTNNPMENIPLADDDNVEEITEVDIVKLSLGSGNKAKAAQAAANMTGSTIMSSTESIPFGSSSGGCGSSNSPAQPNSLDIDINPDEIEEKGRLIGQILEMQNTLDDLSQRVDSIKEENLKLKSENQVLGQYIENLMSASSVFQATNTSKPNSKAGSNSKSDLNFVRT